LPWQRILSLILCDRRYGTRLTKELIIRVEQG
jgi:hypothetical protein